MMSPDQKRAVRQWVVDALAAAGKPIPVTSVVRSPQDAGGLDRPYVLLVDTGSTVRGPAPEQRVRETTLHSYRPGTASVSITVIGRVALESLDDEASAYVQVLEGHLWLPDIIAGIRAVNLSINSITEIPDASSRLAGQSQWEPRAALDITFNRTTLTTAPVDPVSEVEITGTTEPPTPLGTFTVEAP